MSFHCHNIQCLPISSKVRAEELGRPSLWPHHSFDIISKNLPDAIQYFEDFPEKTPLYPKYIICYVWGHITLWVGTCFLLFSWNSSGKIFTQFLIFHINKEDSGREQSRIIYFYIESCTHGFVFTYEQMPGGLSEK